MNWKLLDLAVRRLNPSALRDWKNTFLGMAVWMQAVVVGVLVLLVGVSVLSCWWGLKMKRAARFGAGAASVFCMVLLVLTTEYSLPLNQAFLYAGLAGMGGGFLYAFLERVFQFAAGFVFGTVVSAYLLPEYFHLKVTAGKGRIWPLVIAAAAGLLFALLAKKLKFVLTALEGGVVLGLLCDAFLPVGKIPWVKEKLTEAQILNLLPLVIAATGVLIQLIQLLAIRAEQKALAIPTGEERDSTFAGSVSADHASGNPAQEESVPEEEGISMVQAEEVLVEKAKELALAATRSAEQARLKERYEDVMAGLYGTKVAAERLGMSEEAFVTGMKRAGYTLPDSGAAGEETAKSAEAEKEASGDKRDASQAQDAANQAQTAKQDAADEAQTAKKDAANQVQDAADEAQTAKQDAANQAREEG